MTANLHPSVQPHLRAAAAPASVLVFPHHRLLGDLLARSLGDAPAATRVVGSASTVPDAAQRIDLLRPDVVLIVGGPSGSCGLEQVQHLAEQRPNARLVLSCGDDRLELAARELGARGFLGPKADLASVIKAIHMVRVGNTFFSRGRSSAAAPRLSRRELQVAALVARGESSKCIAASLGLSDRTVETYRMRVMHKLGVKGTAAITMWAATSGVLHSAHALLPRPD